ncbi:hypothetical protein C8R44DRAFT_746323 [Mycena epipterygia]|nr:hypothetical protein C8R44DRAFT_746323 [Mycena epipterygia]
MGDWNVLLDTEDQLGPLLSWNSSGSGTAVNDSEITLPLIEYGNSLMTDILESVNGREPEDVLGLITNAISEDGSDIESVTTSEILTNDGGPVIFCGMGRISVQNDSSDSDKSTHENKPHEPSGTLKHGTQHAKAKKRESSTSNSRTLFIFWYLRAPLAHVKCIDRFIYRFEIGIKAAEFRDLRTSLCLQVLEPQIPIPCQGPQDPRDELSVLACLNLLSSDKGITEVLAPDDVFEHVVGANVSPQHATNPTGQHYLNHDEFESGTPEAKFRGLKGPGVLL